MRGNRSLFACHSPLSGASVLQKDTATGKLKKSNMILAQEIEETL